MESSPAEEVNGKTRSEDCKVQTKSNSDCNGTECSNSESHPTSKSLSNPQTPEYVKRTAKLFESVKITEEIEEKNGVTKRSEIRDLYVTEIRKPDKEGMRICLDSLDGDYKKKPSYLGVSCSNSGYRNFINYDSKVREGFWAANSQRESLVLTSNRLRENSPMRRDFDYKSHNGTNRNSAVVTRNIPIEREGDATENSVSQSEKFINMSTSTKTISTFRNSKDIKSEEVQNKVNGVAADAKVNLKQILDGKNEENVRRGYSNLGFSPKILKSPEKNCNSFLKSISSFENNCKKTQNVKSSTYTRTEQTFFESNNSIQQRIERLYGPGALAQAFYTQKPSSKTQVFEKLEDYTSNGEILPTLQKENIQNPVVTTTNISENNLPKKTSQDVVSTKPIVNGHEAEKAESEVTDAEKNGHYFLKLLKKETDQLESLASFAEFELENGENLPEEISGKLRAAAGKARLLVSQKLHQFEGLCHKNLNEKPGEQFPTTSEDLAGFWDMVMLQVTQVYGVFDELKDLKTNNWKMRSTKKESSATTNGKSPSNKVIPKKSTPSPVSEKSSQKSEAAKKAREEGRKKLLEERRKKVKELKENKAVNVDNEVEIFAK